MKYLVLIFSLIFFVGCTQTKTPDNPANVELEQSTNVTVEEENNDISEEDEALDPIDDTTDLFGEESELELEL